MKLRSLRLLLIPLLLSGLLLPGCSSPQPPRPEQLVYPPLEFALPAVERLELANGIRLYLKQDNEIPLVQITAMIGSGELGVSRELTGFDDLFAGTWRTGGTVTQGSAEFEERIDQLAADLGASMGPYSAQLGLSLRSADLDEGITMLAELLRRPVFAEEKLELARSQALESLRRQNDSPGAIAQRLLRAALYPDHPLGDSPTSATLKRISRDDLVGFHHRYFTPNNLWLAISGDFRRDELLSLLDRALGDWERRAVPAQELPPVSTGGAGEVQVVTKSVPQTTVLVGALGMTKDHPDQYAARVFNFILGGGSFNSRLMQQIRSDRGLAYSAYSYFQVGRRLPGPFVAGTETKNATTLPALRLIREIMDDMRERPVSEAELRVARESLINSFVFQFDDPHAVVRQQMDLDFFDYPDDYLARYRERIAAVTLDDVQRVAREFIRPEQQQIILVGDPAEFDGDPAEFGLPVRAVELDINP